MSTITIADIRARYPQYGEMSDNDLADALHQRFYAERPRGEVYRALGLDPAAAAPSPQPRPASIYTPPPAAPAVQPAPIDGDTVRTSEGSMRMTGIDAPESSQTGQRADGEWPAGQWSTDMLTRLMEANPSQPEFSGTDRYQRLLGTLMSGTTDLNRRMVGAGAALPYMGEQYSREAQAAEAARLGLWSGEFQAPSDYRHETGAAPMGSTAPIPRTPITYDAGMMERARGTLRNLEAELASASEQQRPEIEADIARVSEEIRALEARTMQPEYVEGVMRGVEEQRAAAADPFAGEGIGALLQRRAQQFGLGANEMLVSSLMGLDALQTAASLADTPASAGTREAATGLQEERARTIMEMQQRLADPSLRDEERAILAQRIADMQVGQERLSGIAAGQQAVAGQQEPVDFRGAAEGLRARFADTFGTPPDDPSFWASLAQGAGSMSAFLGAALAGGALGGPGGAIVATGGIGAASNSGQVYEEALQAGASQDDALSAAGWGALVGSSEVIPIGRAFRFLPSGIRDRVAGTMFRRFGEIALNAGEEAAQEAASQALNNLIAQGYYDPERGWSDGVTESALIGGILGAGTGALAQAMGSQVEAPVRAPREEPSPEDVQRGAEITGIRPYVPGVPRQVPDVAPVPAEPQAVATAPLPPGRAAVAPPPAAAARARMGVSIGGQQPFPVEVLGEDPDGIRIREADGTESVLPRQDIEDGDIVISPIEEQAAPAATDAVAAQAGDVGQAAAPVQPQAQPVVGRVDQPAAGQPERSAPGSFADPAREPASWVIRDRETGEAIMETSSRAQIENLRDDRYEAVPIGEHLAQVNQRARAEEAAREADRRAELPKVAPKYAPRNAQAPRQQFPELRYRQPLMAKIASQGGIAPTIQQNGATVPSWAASELAARGVTPQTHPRLFKPGGATDLDNIDPATLGTDAAQLLGTDGTGRYANREAIIEALAGEAAGTPFDVSYGAREARRMEQEARDRRARGLNETIDEGADGRRVMPPDADSSGNQRRINRIAKEVDRKLGEIGGSWTEGERSAIVDRLNREGGSIDDAVHDQAVRSYQEAVTDENAADEPQSPEMGEVPFGDEPLAQRGEPVAGEPGDDRAASGQPAEDDRQREGGRDERGDSGAQPADRGVTDRTAAGDQAVIPGAEISDTQARQQVSDRQRAEIAARQQQSKMRRLGGNEGDAGPLFDTQGDLLDAPAARPAPSPKQRTTKAQREREAQLDRLAEYFAPGNIVRTYGGGHDRVISFDRGTNGEWTATVQAVSRKDGAWVDAPNERPRTHRTEPEARDMRAGPVLVAAPVTAAAEETDRDPIQAQAEAAPLYASRAVSNPGALVEWAKAQGFTNLLAADDLHVTTAFSRDPVAAPTSDSPVTVSDFGQPKRLGDEGAIVLPITGASARRLQEDWQKYRDAGASWDFPSYQPHITLTYDLGDVDLAQVEPFTGTLTLDGETQAPLDLSEPSHPVAEPKFSRAEERYRRSSFSADQLDMKRRAMGTALQQAWKRLGLPEEIRLRVVDRLLGTDADGNVVPVDGSYLMGLVQVALDSTEGSMSTMHHEAIHMLRDPALWGREYGLFSEKEWRALEAEAAASWMDKHNIRELYRDLDPISQIEEAIAAEFSEAWIAKHAPRTPVLARAFNQISRFLKALGNALRGAGFRDAQSVFDAILAGEVGARGQVRGGGQGAAQFSRIPTILRRQQTNPAIGQPSAHTSVPETAIERIQRANAQFGPPAGFHQPPLPMSWTLPKRGLGMAVREAFQDQFLYLRAAQAEIEAATGQPLTDRLNASQRQSLFPARVAERLERLFQGEVKDFFDAMKRASKQAGISREDLWVYMVAKHAPERNAVMQKRDPQRFAAGGGSGIHDSAAQALLADLQAQGKVPALEALAKRLRKMLDDDLLLRRNAGLISDQQYQSWRGMYQNYVPLRGFAERDDGEQIGRLGNGFDMRGKEVRSALGRTSIADDPISQIITMRQEGIVRAEKNRVAKTLMNLVQAYPAPGLWEVVGKLPTRKVLDPKTGMVSDVVDFGYVDPRHAMAVKVGGDKVYLRIEDAYLLDALNRLGGDDPRKLMERIARSFQVSVGAVTRMVAATSTALNPNFTVPNLQSDLIEGLWTAHNVDKKGMAAAYAKAYMPALTEAFRDEFGDAVDWMRQRIMRRQNVSPAQQRRMQQYIEEWKLDGGKINFVALRDMDDVARDIDRMTRRAGRSTPGLKAKASAAGDAMAAAGEAMITAISKLNQPIESASRLAMYVAAREQGLSREKAAALAQDATTNYYRRGAATPTLRAAYAFINPAIQSLEKLGRFAKRPRNWAVAFPAVIVLGALQTLLGALAGDDDDPEGILLYERLSQYDRHRNIIIPTGTVTETVIMPDGRPQTRQRLTTVNWRMAYPLRPFLALGSELMLAAMGRRTPEEVIRNVGSAGMMSWNPLADGQWENMVTPTILDPLVDMRLNRNFMDTPIVPDDRYGAAEGLPRSSQFFERSNTRGAVEIAQFLNRVSGGDAYTPGRIDLYPGHLDYLYRFVTGGTGIFAQQVGGAVLDMATGTPTERRNIPIARAFTSETSSFPEQTLYYDLREELTEMKNRARQAWSDLQADPENAAAREVWDEISGEMNVGVRRNGQLDWRQSIIRPLDLADGALSDLRAELTAVVNGDLPRAERVQRANEIRLQIEAVQRRARAASVQQRAANIATMHPPVP
ncbi:MAG: thermonuclease family protein [Proteobacteria bacterium]|nr:thermonuclease family protein [Pseudomonadota bacterium]